MSLSQKSIVQTSSNALFRILRNGVNIATQIFLARYLLPEDFGILSLGLSFLLIHKISSSWGITEAVMQTDRDRTIRTIYTARSIFCLLMLVATLAMGWGLSFIYREEVVLVVMIMGIGVVFEKFVTIYASYLKKELQLATFGGWQFLSTLIASSIGVFMAYRGMGYMSLLAYYFLRKFLFHGGLMVLSPFSASFGWDQKSFRWLYQFNKYIFGGTSFDIIESRGDDFAVGNIAGSTVLGHYSIAWKLARYFHTMIMTSVNKGVLPSFAKIQDEPDKLIKGYEFLMRTLFIPLIPIYGILFMYSEEFITFIFGDKWAPAAVLFRFQIVYAFLYPMFTSNKNVLLALGKSKRYFYSKLCTVLCFLLTIFPLTYTFHAKGAAMSQNLTFSIGICVLIYFVHEEISFNMKWIITRLVSLSLFTITYLALASVVFQSQGIFSKTAVTGSYVLFYVLLLLLMEGNQLRTDMKRVLDAFRYTSSQGPGRN